MIIRRPKDNDEGTEDWMSRTAWSMQRQNRPRKAFGSRNRGIALRRSASLREEFLPEESGAIVEPPRTESLRSIRSSLTVSSEGSDEFAALNAEVARPKASAMSRAQTLPLNFAVAPRNPSHKLTRSWSLALGSSIPQSRASPPPDLLGFLENAPPNYNVEACDSAVRGRKKHRARRASTMGSIPPLAETPTPLSLGMAPYSGLVESPSLPADCSDLWNSPSSKSTSTRKRRGSPSSGDDLSTAMSLSSSLNSRRSRVRGLSPSRLPITLVNPLFPPPSLSDHRGMSIQESDDESASNVDSSFMQDASFISHGGEVPFLHYTEEKKQDEEDTPRNEILATMSSYGDLEFLTQSLTREEQNRPMVGQAQRLWTIIPPPKWHSSRRAAFFVWLTDRLGFGVNDLGNGVHVLVISATRGRDLLERLRLAAAEGGNAHAPPAPPPALAVFGVTRAPVTCVRKSLASVPSESALDVSLAAELGRLTVEERVQEPPILGMTLSSRPSLGNTRLSLDRSRLSMDPSVADANALLEIPGHETPAPRSSQMVLSSTGDRFNSTAANSRLSSVSAAFSVAPMQTLEFVETYVSTNKYLFAICQSMSICLTPFNFHLRRPQIKQDVGWGSRPVSGRDFGASEAVGSDRIPEMSDRFEQVYRQSGRDSVGTRDGLPCMPMGEDMDTLKGRASHLSIEEVMEEQDSMLEEDDERTDRRRRASLAKYQRVSLYASAALDSSRVLAHRKSIFPVISERTVLEEPFSLSEGTHRFPELPSADHQRVGEDAAAIGTNDDVLLRAFSFLSEYDLMCKASLVCSQWHDVSTTVYARLMMASVGYKEDMDDADEDSTSNEHTIDVVPFQSRGWDYLTTRFPWGTFLCAGGFKRVYKVYNSAVDEEEAVSVMDVDAIVDKKTIAAELGVSALLSSIARRGICPNFVITRGVFTLPYEPPNTHWGCEKNRFPKGKSYVASQMGRKPSLPKNPEPGRFQFIRMELCNKGDVEDFIEKLPTKQLDNRVAKCALFQIAFALHIGAERFSLKHYDTKLLNVFVQSMDTSDEFVMRYGLGAHTFALRMPGHQAFVAKLADYGTANIRSESNGQPVTIAQFTTLENTPPEFMVLGDSATQGHGHDNWGLGLCMLHLFTGQAPYEAILDAVQCPPILKKKLKQVWERKQSQGFSVIRSVIRADVYEDNKGNIVEGEPDETLYDTFYRYLVLFGIPEKEVEGRILSPVWKAVITSLQAKVGPAGRRRVQGTDASRYENDYRNYSIRYGENEHITRARSILGQMNGGLELLLSLCSFDPAERATPLQVINSVFMENLREAPGTTYGPDALVHSYDCNSSRCEI